MTSIYCPLASDCPGLNPRKNFRLNSGGNFYYVTIKNFTTGRLLLNEADFDTEAIIANTGGEAYFNYYKGKFAAMSDCFVFETKLVNKFVYYFLKSIEKKINDVAFSGSGIKHLDKNFFYEFKVSYPKNRSEQIAISNVLEKFDNEIEKLQKRLNKTYSVKIGMMQDLLTGKIRLV